MQKDAKFYILDKILDMCQAYPAYVRWYKDSGSRLAASTIIASSKFFRILTLAFFILDYNRNCKISGILFRNQITPGFGIWQIGTNLQCLKYM